MQGIADYTFIESLGQGNHGEFFLARKPERLPIDVEFVAVKVVSGTGQDAFRRATRELQTFAAVQSPYLVTLYDAGRQGEVFYYSMEYLPEGSLAANPPQPSEHRKVHLALACAARAAQALHDADIVHRDIKPGNILLSGMGAKLSDLGLAQVLSPGATVTGMGKLSSVEFIDPAQLHGEKPSPAGDVWSLGATSHWALTGVGLYGELPANDPLLALRKVLANQPELAPSLTPEAADLINLCIGDTAARPTAGALADRLEALA